MSESRGRDLFSRYSLPGRRYLKLLSGSFMRGTDEQVAQFGAAISSDSRKISSHDLEVLMKGDWREFLTGCWLVGFAKRSEFRSVLYERLDAGEMKYVGKGIAFALARFGQLSDACALKKYLDHALNAPDDRGNQPWCLGALVFIEERLGVELSQDLTASGGLWDRWSMTGFLESGESSHWEREVRGWIELAENFDR